MTGNQPDVTQAQVLALLTWIAAQAIAWGWLTSTPSQVVLAGGATFLAGAWKLADAFLRGKRNEANAAASLATFATTPEK
jgi:hypothetical protein